MVSKLRVLLVVLLCLPLCGAWPNTGKKYPLNIAYTGPGDIVSATAWFGLRAYKNSAANAGPTLNRVIDVFGASTVTGCTIYLKGDGTGGLDMTTSGVGGVGHQCVGGATTFCTVSNTNCSISLWYDQTGAAACSGSSPCHMSQGTAANQPVLKLSGCSSGSLPCVSCTSAGTQYMVTAVTLTQAQPVTVSGVAIGNVAAQAIRFLDATTNSQLEGGLTGTTSNEGFLYAGSANIFATATGNVWHAALYVANGASSSMTIDGSTTSPGNPGTNAFSASNFGICRDAFTNLSDGFESETGIWAGTLTAPQLSSMNSNMRGYWGF